MKKGAKKGQKKDKLKKVGRSGEKKGRCRGHGDRGGVFFSCVFGENLIGSILDVLDMEPDKMADVLLSQNSEYKKEELFPVWAALLILFLHNTQHK